MADQNVMALPDWNDVLNDATWLYLTDEETDNRISGLDVMRAPSTTLSGGGNSSAIGTVLQVIFNSASDLTMTFTGTPKAGMKLKAYAVQASGGTGHKVLLPTGVYFGGSGTNRAALLNTADEYIIAECANIGGTFRFLIYGNNGVTFAAS